MSKRTAGFGIIEIVISIVVVGLVIAGGIFIWNKFQSESKPIDSFQACVDAGNPVLESYPEQCMANGKSYTNPDQKVTAPR